MAQVRCLRCVLDARSIPHDDCVEKDDLAARVRASPRGSCMLLPARTLKAMLVSFGLGDEQGRTQCAPTPCTFHWGHC